MRDMEDELKDHVLFNGRDPLLNILLDMVNARSNTQLPYREGGLFNQPYFMVAYVEPWVKQAHESLHSLRHDDEQPETFADSVLAFNMQQLLGVF